MSVVEILTEIERFIVFSTGSQPDPGGLTCLAAVAATAWITTALARRVIRFVVLVTHAVMVAVASASTVVAACLVLAVSALAG